MTVEESGNDAVVTAEAAGPPWQRLHSDGLKVTALLMAGASVAAGVPIASGIASGLTWPIASAVVLLGAVVLIGAVTAFDAIRLHVTRYRVTDTRVEMITGILFKQRRSLARERIRSVDLTSHPLQRMFSLARVKVGTGESGSGSGSATERSLILDSVGRVEADRLRAELLRHGASDRQTDSELRLVTWQPGWLRYAPLSILTPALAAAAVGAAFQVSQWFGKSGLPVQIVSDFVERYGPWQVLAMGLLALVVLGVIGSLALQGEAWWNHRLDREPGGTLRVRRGLLINRSLSLEEERIRGVEIIEPLGIRSAKAARLDVVAIGLKSEQNKDLTTLVPAAPRDKIDGAAEAIIGSIDTKLSRHPKTARARRLRWAGMFIVALAATVGMVHLLWPIPAFASAGIAIVAVLLAVAAVKIAFDAYASLGHGFNRDYLVARRGSVRRATVHLDRSGIIGWRMTQSLFQRRLGLMTVDATTAAGKGHYATFDADQYEVLDFADAAVPGLLEPFLFHEGDEEQPAKPRSG